MTYATRSEARRMGPRGNIETFFEVNDMDLSPEARAKMREAAIKAMRGATIDVRHCPEHLRDAFRQIVIEAAYIAKVAGQKVDQKGEYMPAAGKVDPTASKQSRL